MASTGERMLELLALLQSRHRWHGNRRFERRSLPAPNAITFVTERLSSLPGSHRVEVVFAAPLKEVEHHLGQWGTATETETGTTRLRMDVDDLSWVVLMLAALNADIRHAEPPELLVLLHTLGSNFTAAQPGLVSTKG